MIDLLQWPAMASSILAAWLVGATIPWRRRIGFWVFLVSNVLWVIWGLDTAAYALVALQVALAVTNVRGIIKIKRSET